MEKIDIDQELSESRAKSFESKGWMVYSNYRIEDGFIRINEDAQQKKVYIPGGRPELSSEFAKLQDGSETKIMNFVKSYGLLGYSFTYQTDVEYKGAVELDMYPLVSGDPLSWITAHANAVNLVMKLSSALDKPSELKALIEGLMVIDNHKNKFIAYKFPVRGFVNPQLKTLTLHRDPGRQHPIMGTKPIQDDPREVALNIICDIISPNLSGVNRILVKEGQKVASLFRQNNLLDVIYWALADAVTAGRVRACEECGHFFIAETDKRRFCPPPIDGDVSLCMNRAKQKRHKVRLSGKE